MYGLKAHQQLLSVLLGTLLVAALAIVACGPAAAPTSDAMKKELPKQLFSPHFVSSSPKHGETLAQAPDTIAINFNFNLHEKSAIMVTRDGTAVTTGKTTVDPNQLAMRAMLNNAGDGL